MEIKPYKNNAKEHPKKQIDALANIVKEVGWRQPVLVNQNGVIVAGHGRYMTWEKYKDDLKPVWVIDDKGKTIHGAPETTPLTPDQETAYRLADNKLNESKWIMELVKDDLRILPEAMIEMTGFDKDLIIDPDEKDDLVPENVPSVTQLGDIYQIGRHRVMCGDSTQPDAYLSLLQGKKADMVFTDPPYNVNYSGTGKNTSEGIMNDKMTDIAFQAFLQDYLKAQKEVMKTGAGAYIFHSHKTAHDFQKALEATGYEIDTQLIWNKPSAGMGMNDYRTKHEPFFYCGIGDKQFYGDRTGTTVWKIPDDEKKAFEWFKKHQALEESGKTTIWSISRAKTNEYVHPTQKPVELVVRAMVNSSKAGDIILDPFLGSGTTLIASEKAGRDCMGIEMDPKYVDIIIQRWCDYTNTYDIIKNDIPTTWQSTK